MSKNILPPQDTINGTENIVNFVKDFAGIS
jgi:hypothetical protein